MSTYIQDFIAEVKARNPHEPEFHQAVTEVAESLTMVFDRYPEYRRAKILERLVEPERVILFRVAWTDDQGEIRINKGYHRGQLHRHGRRAVPGLALLSEHHQLSGGLSHGRRQRLAGLGVADGVAPGRDPRTSPACPAGRAVEHPDGWA